MARLKNWLKQIWGFLFYLGPTDPGVAAVWRSHDLSRLSGANGLRQEAVGPLIGAGLQHHIYEYDGDTQPSVIKLTLPNRWLRFPTADETRSNLVLVSRYFGRYTVDPSRVIELPDKGFAVEQRRLARFHAITPADLANPALRAQLLDVLERNRRMLAETGRAIDVLGREGQRKCRAALFHLGPTPTISNLVFESMPDGTEQLRIIDPDLEDFRQGTLGLRDLRSRLAAKIAFEGNRFLISRLFGIDIAGG